jgi:hypothetical protein
MSDAESQETRDQRRREQARVYARRHYYRTLVRLSLFVCFSQRRLDYVAR